MVVQGMGVSREWETSGPWGVCLAEKLRSSSLGEGLAADAWESWWRVSSKGPALALAHRCPWAAGAAAVPTSKSPALQLPTLPSAITTATKAPGRNPPSGVGVAACAGGAAAAGEPRGCRGCRLWTAVAVAVRERGTRCWISEMMLARACCLWGLGVVGRHTRDCCAPSSCSTV